MFVWLFLPCVNDLHLDIFAHFIHLSLSTRFIATYLLRMIIINIRMSIECYFYLIVVVFFFLFALAVLSGAHAIDCGQEELLQCQRSLSELNEFSDLSFLSRKSNLEKQCPDLLNGLECIQSYTRRCMSQDQRAHFNKLYAGTAEMIHQLCEDSLYQEGICGNRTQMRANFSRFFFFW